MVFYSLQKMIFFYKYTHTDMGGNVRDAIQGFFLHFHLEKKIIKIAKIPMRFIQPSPGCFWHKITRVGLPPDFFEWGGLLISPYCRISYLCFCDSDDAVII